MNCQAIHNSLVKTKLHLDRTA